MTATTTTLNKQSSAGIMARIRRVARVGASILATMGARWSDLAESGQLGPSADAITSRHTGSRI